MTNSQILSACEAVEDACRRLATASSELRSAMAEATNGNEIIEFDGTWSYRTKMCLYKKRVRTWSDLASLTEGELLREKNFGHTSLREVKRRLADQGMRLRKPTISDSPKAEA